MAMEIDKAMTFRDFIQGYELTNESFIYISSDLLESVNFFKLLCYSNSVYLFFSGSVNSSNLSISSGTYINLYIGSLISDYYNLVYGNYTIDNIIVNLTESGHVFYNCQMRIVLDTAARQIFMELKFDSDEANSLWGSDEYLYEYGNIIISPK